MKILKTRIYNQMLYSSQLSSAQEVVEYLGAVQAQAFDLARWGVGVRIPGATDSMVREAINNGEIIRTHVLRPTWHFVSARDLRWMSELCRGRLMGSYLAYSKNHGPGEDAIKKHMPLLEKVLRDHNHLTRQGVCEALNRMGVKADPELANWLVSIAEVGGIVCGGRMEGAKHTYALTDERIPSHPVPSKEEALALLAQRYFTSHGPATLDDFVWWSGLSKTEARVGLEAVKHLLVKEENKGRTFWMPGDMKTPARHYRSVVLLPPFDELVVSYKDRSDMISDENYGKVMTKNGLFSPTVMLDGEIVGSWRKISGKKEPRVEMSFFEQQPGSLEKHFSKACERVRDFYVG